MFIIICLIAIFLLFSRKSEATSALPINSEIQKMLDYLGIENCEITKLPDYSNIRAELTPVTVTEQEVKEYVDEILDIYGRETLSDDFVKKELEANSIEDYYQDVKRELMAGKEVEVLMRVRNRIIDNLIKDSVFSLPEDNVAKYSVEIVKSYENEALVYQMELEEYIDQELQMTKKGFFDMCYNEGEKYIKSYLVVGAIAEKEALTVTKKDITEFSDFRKDKSTNFSDEAKAYISYQILENKVYDMFIENKGKDTKK